MHLWTFNILNTQIRENEFLDYGKKRAYLAPGSRAPKLDLRMTLDTDACYVPVGCVLLDDHLGGSTESNEY